MIDMLSFILLLQPGITGPPIDMLANEFGFQASGNSVVIEHPAPDAAESYTFDIGDGTTTKTLTISNPQGPIAERVRGLPLAGGTMTAKVSRNVAGVTTRQTFVTVDTLNELHHCVRDAIDAEVLGQEREAFKDILRLVLAKASQFKQDEMQERLDDDRVELP